MSDSDLELLGVHDSAVVVVVVVVVFGPHDELVIVGSGGEDDDDGDETASFDAYGLSSIASQVVFINLLPSEMIFFHAMQNCFDNGRVLLTSAEL